MLCWLAFGEHEAHIRDIKRSLEFLRFAHPPRPSPCLDNLAAGWLGGWIVVWLGSLVAGWLGGSVAALLGWEVRWPCRKIIVIWVSGEEFCVSGDVLYVQGAVLCLWGAVLCVRR